MILLNLTLGRPFDILLWRRHSVLGVFVEVVAWGLRSGTHGLSAHHAGKSASRLTASCTRIFRRARDFSSQSLIAVALCGFTGVGLMESNKALSICRVTRILFMR